MSDNYSGKGWDLARLKQIPEAIAAPLAVLALVIALLLFGVGLFLIGRLVDRAWLGGTDTVHAASAALTAIAAVFGAAFLTWRTVVAHWQARASQQQAAIAKESHYTTLFTKAVEQLGATREVQKHKIDESTQPPTTYAIPETQPNLEVRLGAIYALERIARDSERDRAPIIQVLCAYVRNLHNCGEPSEIRDIPHDNDKFQKWKEGLAPARLDIQAAVQVLGFKLLGSSEMSPDLSRSNLQNIKFSSGDFSGAIFDGAFLDAANFNQAACDTASLENTHVHGTTFDHATFKNSVLDSSDFSHVTINRCEFLSSQGVKAKFSRVTIDNADFRYTFFGQCNFSNIVFKETALRWASFRDGHLSSVEFIYTDLTFATFAKAYLSEVVFLGSDLHGVSFENGTFYRVGFFGCDLSEATGLSSEMLAQTFGDRATQLPKDCGYPAHWSPARVPKNDIWAIMNPELAKIYRDNSDHVEGKS